MKRAVQWVPTPEFKESTRLFQWMKEHRMTDYDEFHQYSLENISHFWGEAEEKLGIEWYEKYEKVLDLSQGIAFPEWYTDGKMNVVHNALDKWAQNPETANKQALIWEGDDGTCIKYTFKDLHQKVCEIAAGLHDLGIQRGDVITLYLPMIPETLIAMLAISKIGAIFSPAFSGYKADAVAKRIQASGARYLITADGFYRRGKKIDMKKEADLAVNHCPSIEKVIVVHRTGEMNHDTFSRDVDWKNLKKNVSDFKTEVTDSNDPFMIIYTSGTTGKPKGAFHTHSGFPIKAAFDAGICMDVKQEDCFFWYTDMGWMMGPFLVYGGLINGATIVMFEGTPDFPNPDRLWQIVDHHRVTHLGISPTLVRSMMRFGSQWITKHDLSSLRLIGSTGEPWNPEPWEWLYKYAGNGNIPIFNYSGGTEISGGIFGNVLVKPITPITFNAALPGMDVGVVDSEGKEILGDVGELVLRQPWVGMTRGFYKDNERYEETYWSRFPNTWVHGDWVIKDNKGYYTITGRSDDTLNVSGKRLGPAEIESVIVEHEAVIEAGVIGVPHEVKGEVPIGFSVLHPDFKPTEELKQEIIELTSQKLGKAFALKNLFFVSDLPKTRNAKVMRRAIKTAFLHLEAGDMFALENAHVLEEIKGLQVL
ncbi:AMP-binding protein [Bacillaceae bacterium S4-13-56]